MRKIVHAPRGWETLKAWASPSWTFSILVGAGALVLGVALGLVNEMYSAAAAGAIIIGLILLLRLDELTAALILAVHIFLDWYLNFDVYQLALILSLLLFAICYFGRSANRPWVGPRSIWLWIFFLVLNIYPTLYGGTFSITNSIATYLNIIFSAFVLFWLGNIIAKDVSAIRRVFQFISILATVIAIHTIIQTITGKFLFETAHAASTIASRSGFKVMGKGSYSRSGSFFINPDDNGAFFATCIFLPVGLLIEGKRHWAKIIYVLQAGLILLAMMFTYSTGSWVAVLAGTGVFIFLAARIRYSMLLLLLVTLLAGIAFALFPSQIDAQLQHATDQGDLANHLGTWQTAAGVIEAYPLFGVGLGDYAYLIREEPYRVAAQDLPQAEPDMSYLEWAATSGIPTMLVFLLLLGSVFWFAWRNWRAIDPRYRPLLGGGIVAILALSINGLVLDTWTNTYGLAALGWLIAGLISSSSIGRGSRQQSTLSAAEIMGNCESETAMSLIERR